jgi:hypothetical protein
MNDALDALNARAFMPFQWMYELPLEIFAKERRAFEVMKNVFGDLIEKHKVGIFREFSKEVAGSCF